MPRFVCPFMRKSLLLVSERFHDPTIALTNVKLFVGLRKRAKKKRSRPSSQRRISAFGMLHFSPLQLVRTLSGLVSVSLFTPRFFSGMKPDSLSKYSNSARMMLSTGSTKKVVAVPKTDVRLWWSSSVVKKHGDACVQRVGVKPCESGTGALGNVV